MVFAENEILVQESDISVITIPEDPKPYDDVTIKLESYSTDLNKAMIEWRNDKNVLLKGYGKTSYSMTSGGPDSVYGLIITIVPSESSTSITKKISINPSEVSLVWESVDGYVPPFYKGKSFVTPESLIKVIAIPNTNKIKKGKGNISYTWKQNDSTISEASGYGKDSFVFKNSELNTSEIISVKAESVDGKYSATNTIEIPITKPKMIFYKKSPTEGILYNRSLKNNEVLTEDEVTIVAAPYFLALNTNENDFTYKWKINGQSIDTPSRKTELTIRPSSRGGYATIETVFENLNTFYQTISGSLKLSL